MDGLSSNSGSARFRNHPRATSGKLRLRGAAQPLPACTRLYRVSMGLACPRPLGVQGFAGLSPHACPQPWGLGEPVRGGDSAVFTNTDLKLMVDTHH
jgi:hypothetical protein